MIVCSKREEHASREEEALTTQASVVGQVLLGLVVVDFELELLLGTMLVGKTTPVPVPRGALVLVLNGIEVCVN